jgi:hypothetical protein
MPSNRVDGARDFQFSGLVLRCVLLFLFFCRVGLIIRLFVTPLLPTLAPHVPLIVCFIYLSDIQPPDQRIPYACPDTLLRVML